VSEAKRTLPKVIGQRPTMPGNHLCVDAPENRFGI